MSLTISDYLRELWGNQPWVDFLMNVLGVVILSTFCLLIVIFLIWLERKVIARIQRRIGPNRVGGRYGLLQTVADVIKLLIKEDITPTGADKVAYLLAPFLTVMAALMVWAVMPFAPNIIGVDLNIGIFYFLAISSVSVVALLLAGWGSNNKYALLGAFRSVAQLVSYEVPMILALLVPILLARSMSTVDIVNAQTVPYLIVAPLAALIFFISSLAETGRTPFDLLEAESEIVAGFHVEYGGMKFGMFSWPNLLARCLCLAFCHGFSGRVSFVWPGDAGHWRWLGDWEFIGPDHLFVKMFAVYFVYIWIRGTLPRVRVDQILNFNWKFLVPVSLALVMMTAVLDKLLPDTFNDFARAGAHLLANIILAMITIEILRSYARRQRKLASDDGAAETASGHDDHGHHEPAHEPVAAH